MIITVQGQEAQLPVTQEIVCQPEDCEVKRCWSNNRSTTQAGEAAAHFRQERVVVAEVQNHISQLEDIS